MIMLALKLGRKLRVDIVRGKNLLSALNRVNSDVSSILSSYNDIKKLQKKRIKQITLSILVEV